MKGQPHFGMPSSDKMNLALNEPKDVALHSNSDTTPNMHHDWKENILYCMQNNQKKIIGYQLPTQNPIGLKDNYNACKQLPAIIAAKIADARTVYLSCLQSKLC
jgi:hypothetical protein